MWADDQRIQVARVVHSSTCSEHKLFYGVNFKFSVNANYWEPKGIISEVKPIVGAHVNRFDLIVNPILDTNYTGGFGSLEFVPATRAAYNFNEKWAFAAEEYAEIGAFARFKATE